ncbi:protein KIAA0100-like [Diaphorina citri]|uniref:Protein KIAA0100-like n=1 Tax=Diaphorina citri TaxID=121845 RepID=A0A1S3DLA8_DIACI|nr:protein KIAA0100-like [Diaphorina citri]
MNEQSDSAPLLTPFCVPPLPPPHSGISVKEHFEINVVPLTIGLTRKFYQTMLKFCFPERDPENIEDTERTGTVGREGGGREGGKKGSTSKESNFYVVIDDVDKMKERAEKNKLFIYIKIPEVPIKLSYKGRQPYWAIKQKLTINRASRNLASSESKPPAEAEDKVKMLFGSTLLSGEAAASTRFETPRFFKK